MTVSGSANMRTRTLVGVAGLLVGLLPAAAIGGLMASCMPLDFGERYLADLGQGVGKVPQDAATPPVASADGAVPTGAPPAETAPTRVPARLAIDGSLPGSWPQWRGPNRNGISAEKFWRTDWTTDPPKVAWKAQVGWGHSTVVVSNGRVYAMGTDGTYTTVYCLSAETGDLVWKHTYERREREHAKPGEAIGGPASTPAVDGDRVFTLDEKGNLRCLDAATGEVRWHLSAKEDLKGQYPWLFDCSPLVVGGTLFLDVGSMVALDKTTGRVFWKKDGDRQSYSSPVVFQAGATLLVASFNEEGLVVRRATDGKEVGRAYAEGKPDNKIATPVVQDNQIFVSTLKGDARYEVTKTGLRRVWQGKGLCAHVATPILYGDCLYGFSGHATDKEDVGLVCVDFATGKRLWLKSDIAAAFILADSKLIIMDQRGDLVAAEISPEGCKELGRTHVLEGKGAYDFMTTPVLAGGRIYCRSHAGDLVCLDVREKYSPDEQAAAGAAKAD
jgi:outer membrane protein assembly factor BamB